MTTNYLIVARRKRGMVRLFDPSTARMGKWQRIPDASEAWLTGAGRHLATLTVPVLRQHAEWMGIRMSSKARKSELVDACASETYSRQFDIGASLPSPYRAS